MKRFPLFLLIFCLLGVFFACERDDAEPTGSSRVISRLYISTSDYDGNLGINYDNVFVIDPADSVFFPEENRDSILGTRSAAMGGAFIHFTPFSNGVIFQGSQNNRSYIDTTVQVMAVSPTGVIATNTGRIPNRRFDGVRGLFYTIVNEGNISDEFLLMLNSSTLSNPVGTVDSMFVVVRPRSQRNYTVPRFSIPLNYNPWGIYVSDRNVFVSSFANSSKSEAVNGVVVYKNLTTRFVSNTVDTVINNPERFDLEIAGAKNIRGISYSKSKDLLVVTDFETINETSKGRILFFQNFSKFDKTQTITPDRIVTSSELQRPSDIAIDTREDGKFVYIADSGVKKVLRFNIEDNGDVAPNASVGLFGRTPVSLSLDARSGVLF